MVGAAPALVLSVVYNEGTAMLVVAALTIGVVEARQVRRRQ
jgi:hypothetical protein